MAKKGKKASVWDFMNHFEGDKVVWIIVLILILLSIVCIFSSTSRLLEGDMTRIDIVTKQLKIVALGLFVIILCYNVKDINWFRKISPLGLIISLFLLLLLVGKIDTPIVKSIEINGARRILQVPGMQIHVYEVVKVAMVIYLSWAMDALNKGELRGPKKTILQKALYIYGPMVLIFVMVLMGSNSSALFIGLIMTAVILLGGGSIKEVAAIVAAGAVILALCLGIYKVSNGKAFKRIGVGIDRIFNEDDYERTLKESKPGTIAYREALDKVRQPYSAKIAIKQGGVLGKGPGQSTQRYAVSDISEDFMYSFIVEEYGLWGALLVIILYVSLLARGSIIVRNCGDDLYAKLTVAGLCLLITGQAFLHMFVNADIGPMTGQTLPLVSHGNSAFLCFSLAFGVILSISKLAARRIDKETMAAAPISEIREEIKDETFDEFNDYGI